MIAACRCVTLGEQGLPLYSLLPYHPRRNRGADPNRTHDMVSRMLLSRKDRPKAAAEHFLAEQMALVRFVELT